MKLKILLNIISLLIGIVAFSQEVNKIYQENTSLDINTLGNNYFTLQSIIPFVFRPDGVDKTDPPIPMPLAAPRTKLSAPRDLSAYTYNYTAQLSWNAVAGATEYIIQYREYDALMITIRIPDGNSTSYTLNSLDTGNYVWTIQAINNRKNTLSKKVIGPNFTIVNTPPIYENENYIKSTEYLTEKGERGDKKVSIIYFDGLGRKKQAVWVSDTPSGKDIITHYEYDGLGRKVKDFLPVPSSHSNGELIPNPSSLYTQYYGQNYETSYFYSEKELENSPLRRVLKQAAPGDSWKLGSGHEIKNEYQLNESGEIRRFKVNLGLNNEPSLNDLGFYPSATLYKIITKDENWTKGRDHTLEEFKSTEGKTLLQRTYNNDKHDTYYIYDIYGNLTYVLPPMLSEKAIITRELLDELGYQYKYDEENRLVEKKLPGKGWEYLVYDKQDRVVLTQDSEQRKKNRWLFVKYDKFGRVVYTGYITNSSNRLSLQANAYSRGVNNETPSDTGFTVGGLKVYYDNKTAIPNGITEVLTVNYYDSYLNTGAPEVTSVEGQTVLTRTDIKLKGTLTGSFTKLLDGNTQGKGNHTYMYYDTKIRPVRIRTQNYLGGFTQTDSKLESFRGKTEYAITTHSRATSKAEITLRENFTYDKQERLLTHTHQVNGGKIEYLSQNVYDELGRMKNKKVGGLLPEKGLQQIDYKYNIRGWLTEVNNPKNLSPSNQPKDLFAYKLNYDRIAQGVSGNVMPLFNGNIAEAFWVSASDNIRRGYGYKYDSMSRLLDAYYEKGGEVTQAYNEEISYDKNGNILSLTRYGEQDINMNTVLIDELAYTYSPSSNYLLGVKDASNHPAGFSQGKVNGNGYRYDTNGNMTQDLYKGISEISYNNLNLPVKITSTQGIIEYLYDATGLKLQKKVTDKKNNTGVVTDYLGGFQYTNTILQFFPQQEGYYDYVKKNYVYNYTDQLGNIRLSYSQNPADGSLEVWEENHYYPFGMKHQGYTNINKQPKYKYKYNGQEFQEELGLNITAMDFRQYDMALGRFTGMDALSAYNPSNSPYAFSLNNPIFWSDPSGLWHAIYDTNHQLMGYTSDGGGDAQDFFRDNTGNFSQNIDYFMNYVETYMADYSSWSDGVMFNIAEITLTTKDPAVVANTIYNIAQNVVAQQRALPDYIDRAYDRAIASGQYGKYSPYKPDAFSFNFTGSAKGIFGEGNFTIGVAFANNDAALVLGAGGGIGIKAEIPGIKTGFQLGLHDNYGGNKDVLGGLSGTDIGYEGSLLIGGSYSVSATDSLTPNKSGVQNIGINAGLGFGGGATISKAKVYKLSNGISKIGSWFSKK